MDKCEMCGSIGAVTYRPYKYDNDEQFTAHVCGVCAIQHDILTKGISLA